MKLKGLLLFLIGGLIFSTQTFAQKTVKVAFIDPLSGAMGEVGDGELKHFKFVADKIKAKGGFLGGMNFEIVPFDNKINANIYFVELQTTAGTVVSPRVEVGFPADCSQNVALVRFIQTR